MFVSDPLRLPGLYRGIIRVTLFRYSAEDGENSCTPGVITVRPGRLMVIALATVLQPFDEMDCDHHEGPREKSIQPYSLREWFQQRVACARGPWMSKQNGCPVSKSTHSKAFMNKKFCEEFYSFFSSNA